MGLSIQDKVGIFRSYCVGFGHTEGKPLNKACFTVGSGRDFDLHTYDEVAAMVKEISLASQVGELSVCQKSVLHQLKSYGVLAAFHCIAAEEEALTKQERKCKNCYFNAYGGECQLSCYQVDDEDTCEEFSHVDDDHDTE